MYQWEAGGFAKSSSRRRPVSQTLHESASVPTAFGHYEKLGLSLTTALRLNEKMGFTELLPAQARCFGHLYRGADAVLHSRTGSGKTLAFLLPVVEKYLVTIDTAAPADDRTPFLIVLVSSAELAAQTQRVVNDAYEGRIACLVAGQDYTSTAEPPACDILVATVSALDHLVRGAKAAKYDAKADASDSDDASDDEAADEEEAKAGTRRPRSSSAAPSDSKKGGAKKQAAPKKDEDMLCPVPLRGVRALIIDEVDETLGPKFSAVARRAKNVLKILRRRDPFARSPAPVQHVLVGATIPDWVQRVGFLGEPTRRTYFRLVSAGASKLPPALKCYTALTSHSKDARVAAVMALLALPQFEGERAIVFARSTWVDALAAAARQAGITGVRVLTGEQDDVARMAAITEFNTKAVRVLICTDRISRGLDFPDVGLVIHSALPPPSPTSVETFVHRSGRAARVGRNGATVAIVSRDAGSEDANMLEMIRSTVHCEFAPLHIPSHAASTPTAAAPVQGKKGAKAAAQKAAPAAAEAPKVECVLRLRKGANVTKTARAVVEAALEPAARATAEFAASEDPLCCNFRLAAEHVAAAKKSLWKYGLSVDGI